jgi:hypothetical protein
MATGHYGLTRQILLIITLNMNMPMIFNTLIIYYFKKPKNKRPSGNPALKLGEGFERRRGSVHFCLSDDHREERVKMHRGRTEPLFYPDLMPALIFWFSERQMSMCIANLSL